MARSLLILLLTFLSCCLLGGCGGLKVYEEKRLPRGLIPVPAGALAQYNQNVLANGSKVVTTTKDSSYHLADNVAFDKEWEWNKDKTAPPRVGLALSGGGIRSSAFSIGVLAGLSDNDMLDKVDVMSSVSGGSYALSWFFMQQYKAGKAGKEIWKEMFAPQGKYQQYLLKHSHFFSEFDYLTVGLRNLALVPANILLNGVFGSHTNTSVGSNVYERHITKLFLKQEGEEEFFFEDMASPYDVGEFAKKNQLPFFIINTAAIIEDGKAHFGGDIANTMFEFTPIQYGSDAYGRYRYSDSPEVKAKGIKGTNGIPVYKFSTPVAISGAAVDANNYIYGPSQFTLMTMLNQDLGRYIDNPRIDRFTRAWSRSIPLLYFFNHYHRDIDGSRIYLTDGGHSENLGAFPLVRRLCKTIIIVDAEHDPYYEFGSYLLLQKALREEMGISFVVEDIEAILKKPIRDSISMELLDNRLNDHPEDGERWKKVSDNPVMEGEIASLPYPGRSDKITVIYVKLAYRAPTEPETAPASQTCSGSYNSIEPSRLLDSLFTTDKCVDRFQNDTVKNYFCCIVDKRYHQLFNISDTFPQQPTKDQNFNRLQFDAYVTLGRQTIRNYLKKHASSESLSDLR